VCATLHGTADIQGSFAATLCEWLRSQRVRSLPNVTSSDRQLSLRRRRVADRGPSGTPREPGCPAP